MRQLIINEWRHSRVVGIATLVVALVAGAALRGVAGSDLTWGFRMLLLFVPPYLGLVLPATSFRAETRNGTWRFLRALPAPGSTIVSAKFAGAMVVLALGLAGSATGLLLAEGLADPAGTLASLRIPLVLGTLLLGVDFWLCFWLGERHATVGLMAILVVIQVVGTALLVFRRQGLVAVESIVSRLFAWVSSSTGFALSLSLSIAALLGCWAASVAIFDRRDMTHPM